ncbi:hypothetical protein QTP86_001787 [Hemibagrus guttatus]|nr:hypothetical protein QTP86_001787 [Hemibagrus guttatus]
MPEPPQLPPFDVEEQRLYSELLLGDRAPYPISKGASRHPTEEAHFGRLYPGSYPFGHDPELMTIVVIFSFTDLMPLNREIYKCTVALLRDKLFQLNVPDSMCSWITDFLTNRPQFVRLGMHVSDLQHISTGSPQGCVLSPLLFSLYTHGCTSGHQSVKLLKFADDTTLIGLISDGDESAYGGEMDRLVSWCSMNNLELNSLKTVEVIVDFRKDPSSVTLR